MDFLKLLTTLSSRGVSMTIEYDDEFMKHMIKLKKGDSKSGFSIDREDLIYGGPIVRARFEEEIIHQINRVANTFDNRQKEWREKYAQHE